LVKKSDHFVANGKSPYHTLSLREAKQLTLPSAKYQIYSLGKHYDTKSNKSRYPSSGFGYLNATSYKGNTQRITSSL